MENYKILGVDSSKFTIYEHTESKNLIAIDLKEDEARIYKLYKEFGELDKIPMNEKIKGYFLEYREKDKTFTLGDMHLKEVFISDLVFHFIPVVYK